MGQVGDFADPAANATAKRGYDAVFVLRRCRQRLYKTQQ